MAATQWWHSDSFAPGLSVVCPLVPVNEENGSIEFLPGTHHLHQEHVRIIIFRV